ncbi:MAG: ATP-binding protein [Deltaproteobacteria bacterium]|nr:ATP-binding protein [Deltaproteobacteria bacterium]
MRTPWGFYGRQNELGQLAAILRRGRWFFLKLTGRRRIGKTSLVQEALKAHGPAQTLYLQIPDSDPAGVLAAAREFYELFQIPEPHPSDLQSLARSIGTLVRSGYVVAVDEFQYFLRRVLFDFNSYLQVEVDRLAAEADTVRGGLIVLGSIHTEMDALLEDRTAPLFNRITDQIDLPHLDLASVLEILRTHADSDPARLLFLWNLFEGVPKFFRDCHEQEVLGAERRTVLERMFFLSSSPLRTEADNWFLRELHGRYDMVLKFIARHPGCSNAEITQHARSLQPDSENQIGGYVKILRERYRMIERLQPVFAAPTARNGRFYIRDNFLRSWLAALAVPAASVSFRPLGPLVDEADRRLADAEGHGLERLVGALYEERSRKGLGDFSLTERITGYWDRQGTEIDLVALNEDQRVVRLGTCKRNADRLIRDLPEFDGHIARFVGAMRRLRDWRVERVAVTPRHTLESRQTATSRGYVPQDLVDLTTGL